MTEASLVMSPDEIRVLRKREGVSREDFAYALWASPSLIGRWERGQSVPTPTAFKLLDIVRRKGLDFVR